VSDDTTLAEDSVGDPFLIVGLVLNPRFRSYLISRAA